MHHLFFYGTLKHGCQNHAQMAGHRFLGPARTVPGYRLYDLGDFPGMVAKPDDREGVEGEVWAVDDAGLKHLDAFEGAPDGPYRRERVPLLAPFAHQVVEAYIYTHSIAGRREIGAVWRE